MVRIIPSSSRRSKFVGTSKVPRTVSRIVRSTTRPKITLTRAMKKAIKRVKIGEKKYFMTDSAGFVEFDNTGTITDLSLCPQGDSDSTRDGDQLTLRSLELNIALKSTSTAANSTAFARVILFQWYPNSLSSVPSLPLVLFDRSGTMGALWPFFPYNHDNRFLYRILYDKVFALGSTQDQAQTNHLSRKIRIRRFPKRLLQYAAATTEGNNHLYLLVVTDRTAATTDVFTAWTAKLNFQDS